MNKHHLILAARCAAGTALVQAPAPAGASAGAGVQASRPDNTPAMQRLRESIQALAQQAAMVSAYQPGRGGAPVASSGTGADTGSMGTSPGSQGSAQASGATVLVLVPSVQADDAQFARGCWVRFYDDKGFKGDSLTLTGPIAMPKMEVPGGAWKNWDSAIVTTYDNENYRDRSATLKAGQAVDDLRAAKLGWFEQMKSARVACAT